MIPLWFWRARAAKLRRQFNIAYPLAAPAARIAPALVGRDRLWSQGAARGIVPGNRNLRGAECSKLICRSM